MDTGAETEWVRLPNQGTVHAFTVCYSGSEEFPGETPFVLALIEFEVSTPSSSPVSRGSSRKSQASTGLA